MEYLADHFENEVWYIQHIHSVLEGLLTGLPTVYSRAVMVQQEVVIVVIVTKIAGKIDILTDVSPKVNKEFFSILCSFFT